jgi:hypothetical protein
MEHPNPAPARNASPNGAGVDRFCPDLGSALRNVSRCRTGRTHPLRLSRNAVATVPTRIARILDERLAVTGPLHGTRTQWWVRQLPPRPDGARCATVQPSLLARSGPVVRLFGAIECSINGPLFANGVTSRAAACSPNQRHAEDRFFWYETT